MNLHNKSSDLSHVTDVLQPVVAAAAAAAAFFRQGEANVAALLPAAPDLPESPGDARRHERQAAQQNRQGEDQDQREGGRQEEAVLGRIEGAVPAEEERVEGRRGQSAVAQRGLQEVKEGGGGVTGWTGTVRILLSFKCSSFPPDMNHRRPPRKHCDPPLLTTTNYNNLPRSTRVGAGG